MNWLYGLVARIRGTPASEGAAEARARVEACLRDDLLPALESVRDRLLEEGHAASLEQAEDRVTLAVTNFNGLPLEYSATIRVYKQPVVNLSSFEGTGEQSALKHFGRIEIVAGGRRREHDPARCGREAIERAALKYYRRFLMDTPRG